MSIKIDGIQGLLFPIQFFKERLLISTTPLSCLVFHFFKGCKGNKGFFPCNPFIKLFIINLLIFGKSKGKNETLQGLLSKTSFKDPVMP